MTITLARIPTRMIILPEAFDKKVYFFVVVSPIRYIKESQAELGKVVWPTRQVTIRLTTVVLFVAILTGAYIAGLDTLFTKIFNTFIK